MTYEITHYGFLRHSIDSAFWFTLRLVFGVGFVEDNLLLHAIGTLFWGILPLLAAFAAYGILTSVLAPQNAPGSRAVLRKGWRFNLAVTTMLGLLMGTAIGSLFIHHGLRFDPYLLLAVGCGSLVSSIAYTLLMRSGEPGHTRYCRCGYDLTGNISGVCPECGETIDQANAGM